MSDTARDFQTIKIASTDGLEDLFSVDAASSETVAGPSRDEDAGPSRDEGAGPSRFSALQAAKILGINKRSVIRLIQEQKLPTIKHNGKYLIEREAIDQRKQSAALAGSSRDEGPPSPISDVAVDIEVPGPSQDEVPAPQVVIEVEAPPPVFMLNAHQLLKELEGATYRVGYLEAQLAERDQLIKLLTDSQHKPAWWRRTWQWFIGTNS